MLYAQQTTTVSTYLMSTNPTTLRRMLPWLILIAVAVGAFFAWKPFKAVYISGVPKDIPQPAFVYIPTGANFEQVIDSLRTNKFINDEAGFRWLAGEMNYRKDVMRSGRYEIQAGWHNRELIQHLRAGKQAPVKVVLNNERLPEEIAGKVARVLETDSLSLLQVFQDKNFLAESGYTTETLLAAIIPNTYEMYWNTDAKTFFKRLVKENEAFWSKNGRLDKAKALGLTPTEVYILASIVERETNHNPEKPTIAGVYLNRLRINMRLQADPTSVFATRDFLTRRVTEYHTTFDSPYNTYVYTGLPPGPISLAAIPTLDAVLNPATHKYLYFCAKPDESGTHAFAETFSAHKVNAQKFQAYISKKGL
ncbi:MAG: endolytic transglycosylase MltG [Saprospiraceae bacterium]|nr:endolytic transglycosylase MltG [Saprospiraceae bacterium]